MADLLPEGSEAESPDLPPPIERVRWLVIGGASAIVVGLLLAMVAPLEPNHAAGGALIALGIILLLAGGTSGGGFLQRKTAGDPSTPQPSPLLSRLRPEAHPPSRWLVGAGMVYAAVGAAVIEWL